MVAVLPASGRRARDMVDKRARILDAARQLFAERGFSSVTTQEVSTAADIATGTLFRYASTKAELLLMVYNEEFAAAVASGEAASATACTSDQAAWAMVKPVVAFAADNRENSTMYLRELLFGSHRERFRDEGIALVARWEHALAERLGGGTSSALAARSIFGVLTLWISGTGDEHRPLPVIRAQIEQIVAGASSGGNSID